MNKMKIFFSVFLLLASFQLSAQQDRKTIVNNIERILQKAVDKKQAITGLINLRFTGESLTMKTDFFTIEYPNLDFSIFTESKIDEGVSPTGFKTLWLYFSQEQERKIDGKPQISVQQFSVYIRPEDVSAIQAALSSLASLRRSMN